MDTNIIEANGESRQGRHRAYEIICASQGRKLQGEDLAVVRQALKDVPDLWQVVGRLGDQLRENALGVFENETLLQESVKAGMEQMRMDLRTQHKSPVELLAIEQVITCWLQCQITGLRLETATKGSHGFKEGLYWEQRYTQAMNRLNRSMELLHRLNTKFS